MRIVWTRDARDDLESLLEYIHRFSPAGAANVAARLETTIASIGEFPHAGRLDSATHVGRYPLLIVYLVHEDFAEIIAVFHTSRDPDTKRRAE